MPELPEVETIKQIIAHPDAENFAKSLLKQKFSCIGRRSKFLIFHLENGNCLFLHLRMTRQLLATPNDYPIEKHTHLVLHLNNKIQLQ